MSRVDTPFARPEIKPWYMFYAQYLPLENNPTLELRLNQKRLGGNLPPVESQLERLQQITETLYVSKFTRMDETIKVDPKYPQHFLFPETLFDIK